ncbi:MAG TPA: hypothetical protein VGF39_05910 [Stellaceae bacterium]|jgi:hypothetical protein
MRSFAPQPVLTPHYFEIVQNGRGYWVAKEKEGLIGGVFRTQKDAVRFALFEVAGDSTCVRVFPVNGPVDGTPLDKSRGRPALGFRRSLRYRSPMHRKAPKGA